MPTYKYRRARKEKSKPATRSLQQAVRDSVLDDCLLELEQAQGPTTGIEKTAPPPAKRVKTSDTISHSSLLNNSVPNHPLALEQRTRIQEWNLLFRSYCRTHEYSTGLLPSFDLELTRHFQVNELSKYLLEACVGIKIPALERWIIDAKVEERMRAVLEEHHHSMTDVVLSRATVEYECSQRLVEEICELGQTRGEATKIVKELCRRTRAAIHTISANTKGYVHQTPLKKGDRIELEKNDHVYTLVYRRKRWKKPFCIKVNRTHYEKLADMFCRVHNQYKTDQCIKLLDGGKPTKAQHAFHLIVMVLLVRYSSLAGGQLLLDLRGGGMQGAIHAEVFDVLREYFVDQPMLECFASPLNAYLPSFASAFSADLDWHFGSVGDFLDSAVHEGCCEANPPFTPGLIDLMVDRMEYNLDLADAAGKALTFCVIIPTASPDGAAAKRYSYPPFQRLVDKSRLHCVLSAKEHGYIEGAQHLRPTRYKSSIFDTSFIMLQSQVARDKMTDVAALEEHIRRAFGSKHHDETEKRRADKHKDEE